jgi:hypothetical protein
MPFKSDAGMTVQQFDRYRSSNLGHLAAESARSATRPG